MEERLKEIVTASAKLFLKYGIRSVTMDDVARHLSLSKKTLYQFIKDKTDLVEKAVLLIGEEMSATHCAHQPGINAVEKQIFLYESISKYLMEINPSFEYDLKKYFPAQYQLMVKSRRKQIFQEMSKHINQGISEGFFRKEMDVEKVVLLNMIRMESVRETDVLDEFGYKILDVLDEFFHYHVHAIATPKGIKEYNHLMNERKHD